MDGELPPAERAETEEHLDACEACSERIRELEDVAGALERASREARQPPEELRESTFREPRSLSYSGSLRAAAVIAAVLVGGAAVADAALPGHPVRSWLRDAVRSVTGDEPGPAPGPPGWGGLSVEPDAGSVRVEISGARPGSSVVVRFVDGPRASVSARGGTFRTGSGLLELIDPDAGEIRVRVPNVATTVRVTANGRSLLEREGGELRLAPTAARDSVERTFRFPISGDGR